MQKTQSNVDSLTKGDGVQSSGYGQYSGVKPPASSLKDRRDKMKSDHTLEDEKNSELNAQLEKLENDLNLNKAS
jgi:hypothetical protein